MSDIKNKSRARAGMSGQGDEVSPAAVKLEVAAVSTKKTPGSKAGKMGGRQMANAVRLDSKSAREAANGTAGPPPHPIHLSRVQGWSW